MILKKLRREKFLNPYISGFFLGLTLLLAIVIYGNGLGASGAMMRSVTYIEKIFVPKHVNNNVYLATMGKGDENPMSNWIVLEVVGVLIGGFLSGLLSGRLRKGTNHGSQITSKQRLKFSFLGGALFGGGARLARGCTSGVALSGGATLSVGSWVTMLTIFAVAYITAYFVRKLWI